MCLLAECFHSSDRYLTPHVLSSQFFTEHPLSVPHPPLAFFTPPRFRITQFSQLGLELTEDIE